MQYSTEPIDEQGSDTSSQYGDHFRLMVQGHAVKLTFKVSTQTLFATRPLCMVIISVKYL